MTVGLRWEQDGQDWPNRDSSRFVRAAGLCWHVQEKGHVQEMGTGAKILLLHGTGAATHSWAGLLPLLAQHSHVLACDLPGHGFTGMPLAEQMSLPAIARRLAVLLDKLGFAPDLVVGHSAGAAIASRMILDGTIRPRALFSLNGALMPLPGRNSQVFPAAARLLARTRVVPWIFSLHAANRDLVERLLGNTGSKLDTEQLRFYRRLLLNPGHVSAALQMMAHWDLRALADDLPRLAVLTVLVAGSADGMIPPADAERLHAILPQSRLVTLEGLGHLAHEEQPAAVAALIGTFVSDLRGSQAA